MCDVELFLTSGGGGATPLPHVGKSSPSNMGYVPQTGTAGVDGIPTQLPYAAAIQQ